MLNNINDDNNERDNNYLIDLYWTPYNLKVLYRLGIKKACSKSLVLVPLGLLVIMFWLCIERNLNFNGMFLGVFFY